VAAHPDRVQGRGLGGGVTPYYEAAGITIYHGDCREVLCGMDTVDHVITDPPYSRDVYRRARKPESCSSSTPCRVGPGLEKLKAGEIGSVDELVEPVAEHIGWLLRRWALVFSDVEFLATWRARLQVAGLRYVRTGAWVKPDAMPQMTGDRPAVGFEPVTIAHVQSKMRWNGGGKLAVWTHNTAKGNGRPDHPCPKPLPLMTELVGLFTDPGEIILDPFMGSGTTLRAAKDLGRRAIGIEINEKYCEIAAKRLEQEVLPLWR
jgi:site-specific DNA-methyltransferase (adenine-specific)